MKAVLYVVTFILSWCMRIHTNGLLVLMWHPVANKFYPIHQWYGSLVYGNACSQLMISIPISVEESVIVCWLVQYHPCPI
jgi:hypothetical protein